MAKKTWGAAKVAILVAMGCCGPVSAETIDRQPYPPSTFGSLAASPDIGAQGLGQDGPTAHLAPFYNLSDDPDELALLSIHDLQIFEDGSVSIPIIHAIRDGAKVGEFFVLEIRCLAFQTSKVERTLLAPDGVGETSTVTPVFERPEAGSLEDLAMRVACAPAKNYEPARAVNEDLAAMLRNFWQ